MIDLLDKNLVMPRFFFILATLFSQDTDGEAIDGELGAVDPVLALLTGESSAAPAASPTAANSPRSRKDFSAALSFCRISRDRA